MEVEIKEDELLLRIEKALYSEEVLHKCFYWYSGNFAVDISNFSAQLFLVRMRPTSKTQTFQETIDKVRRDLIDFKLRDIVTKETKTVRELIVAKAFAYYNLNETPITVISDPVGFDPAK